jgi:uncharacterized membrane protein
MWTRAELKDKAKTVLRKYYWLSFLVILAACILGGSQHAGSPSFGFNFNSNDLENLRSTHPFGVYFNWGNIDVSGSGAISWIMALILGSAAVLDGILVCLALVYAYKIFVGGVIETGMDRYFLDAREDRADFAKLFYSFGGGRYTNTVLAIAWRELFLFLWTLLLIIPGIVKSYAYSMIPYIMADNPNMDYRRAMKLSMAMTDGEKWYIFVLQLSFIGWYLLGLLACCVGVVFVIPYEYATMTELYVVLRRKAIDSGLCSTAELGL